MVLVKLLWNQLNLDILLLSSADVYTGNGRNLLKFRSDALVHVIIKVFRCIIVDRQSHGSHIVDIHLHNGRIVCILRQSGSHQIHLFL